MADGAAKEFHASELAGITAAGSTSTTDTLVLHGGSLNFDFRQPATSDAVKVASIEKIDITGSGNNTIKLTLASVTQADFDGSIHKLYITGDAGDAVELTKPTVSWVASDHLTSHVLNGVTYKAYQLDSTHELLINNAITTLTVS
jgi:hypothetical protein